MTGVLARLRGVERRFGSVVALDGADLELRAGEVHGLLGANGAGKSTLLNVFGGMLRPDAGAVELDGVPVSLASPREAWLHGIALVHQHFTLVPRFSVLENLSLGVRDSVAGGTVRDATESLMLRTGLRVPLDAVVETLGVGDRQRIEILKALLRDPRVVVLDEPTAVLTPQEVEGLFGLLRTLADEGRAVVLVAHKLDEVLAVADRVTVLRQGRTVVTGRREELEVDALVRAMVGAEATEVDPSEVGAEVDRTAMASGASEVGVREMATSGRAHPTGPVGRGERESMGEEAGVPARGAAPVLRTSGASVVVGGEARLRALDLEVHAGEIVGVAGVEGNGQRELARLLAGRLAPTAGSVRLPAGIGFVPQDRSTEGLIGSFDLTENVALALHGQPDFHDGVWLRWDRIREAAVAIRGMHEVAAPSVRTRAEALSGGNRQRLLIGRELSVARDVLVAENPTRGLDVSAAAFVHAELRRLADEGIAIVLVSTDLDEVLALSDRAFAISRGRLRVVPRASWTRAGVGALMLSGPIAGGGDDG